MRSGVLKSCWLGISAVAGVSGALAACSGAGMDADSQWSPSDSAQSNEGAPSSDPIAGIKQELLTPLATAPTFASSTLAITVAPGELGMVSIRSIDSAIIVNGVATLSAGNAVTVNDVHAITITESAAAAPVEAGADAGDAGHAPKPTTEFIVDYSNGLFATGLSSGGGITLHLNGTEPTVFGVRGTSGADTFVFGSLGVNVNGDAYPDIIWATQSDGGSTGTNGGAGAFVVSMGDGHDTWSAAGGSGTGLVFSNERPANPAVGYGLGVAVYGGAGDDTFYETVVTPHETISGGGQAGDTVDYSARSTHVAVTLSLPGIPNMVSGECVISGARAGDAGDAGDSGNAASDAGDAGDGGAGAGCVTDEYDDIKNDVFIVYGGSNDDFLTASSSAVITLPGADAGADGGDAGDAGDSGGTDSGSSDSGDGGVVDDPGYSVTFYGQAGNDTLTPFTGPYMMVGGAGNDTFVMGTEANHGAGTIVGGAGVDFVDFSQRTQSVCVTMDGITPSGTCTLAPDAGASDAGDSGSDAGANTVTENMIVSADIENVHGGAANDVIVGNANDNVINGGPGSDSMTGGGAGSDTVDYSDANGPVWAQIGTSTSGAGTFTQTRGTASLAYSDATCTLTSSSENDTIGADITNLIGSKGSDCLFGQALNSACPGTTCQNTLVGGPGSDMLFGYDQNDILEGSGGLGGDAPGDSNYLDCGGGDANTGHDLGVVPPGYRINCQF